ncbi:MAG: DUF72 domain-containing protein [Nitrospinota bacterium]|nr:DUF72 domain-containing protein [Nitrospinota bacterium]
MRAFLRMMDLLEGRLGPILFQFPYFNGRVFPKVDEIHRRVDSVTADFSYIRFLGDRYGIEAETKDWDRLIWDRTEDMNLWMPIIQEILSKGVKNVFVYFNNHYAGHAPGSVREFQNAWGRFLSR